MLALHRLRFPLASLTAALLLAVAPSSFAGEEAAPAAAATPAAATPAAAQPGAGLTAEQIIGKSTENRNVGNSVQTLQLRTFDKNGKFRDRTVTSKIRGGGDEPTRSYVRIDKPADEAGMAFVSVENPGGEDDQWMSMPAMGLVNRISGGDRKGRFFGTDFTYEDMAIGQVDDGTHTLKGVKPVDVDGKKYTVHVIETVPKPELDSSYAKLVTWIDSTEFVPRQVLFFDSKGEKVKRLTLPELKKEGDMTIPVLTRMENLKRGTRTEITVLEYRLDVPAEELPDSMFTEEYLKSEE